MPFSLRSYPSRQFYETGCPAISETRGQARGKTLNVTAPEFARRQAEPKAVLLCAFPERSDLSTLAQAAFLIRHDDRSTSRASDFTDATHSSAADRRHRRDHSADRSRVDIFLHRAGGIGRGSSSFWQVFEDGRARFTLQTSVRHRPCNRSPDEAAIETRVRLRHARIYESRPVRKRCGRRKVDGDGRPKRCARRVGSAISH